MSIHRLCKINSLFETFYSFSSVGHFVTRHFLRVGFYYRIKNKSRETEPSYYVRFECDNH